MIVGIVLHSSIVTRWLCAKDDEEYDNLVVPRQWSNATNMGLLQPISFYHDGDSILTPGLSLSSCAHTGKGGRWERARVPVYMKEQSSNSSGVVWPETLSRTPWLINKSAGGPPFISGAHPCSPCTGTT